MPIVTTPPKALILTPVWLGSSVRVPSSVCNAKWWKVYINFFAIHGPRNTVWCIADIWYVLLNKKWAMFSLYSETWGYLWIFDKLFNLLAHLFFYGILQRWWGEVEDFVRLQWSSLDRQSQICHQYLHSLVLIPVIIPRKPKLGSALRVNSSPVTIFCAPNVAFGSSMFWKRRKMILLLKHLIWQRDLDDSLIEPISLLHVT